MGSVVLGLDTSGSSSFVALVRGGAVLAEASSGEVRIAESLITLVDAVLREGASSLAEIKRIVVATGPGSFTGIRSGLATAQGLSLALGVPAYGLPSLYARAVPFAARARYLVPHLTASPSERFFAIYRSNNEIDPLAAVQCIAEECFEATVQEQLLAAGANPEDAVFLDVERPVENPAALIAVAGESVVAANGPLEPLYVKKVHAKTIEERLRKSH